MKLGFILAWASIFSTSAIIAQQAPSAGRIKSLYNSLDPTSIAKHFAFYYLYPNTLEGKKALREAYQLLSTPGAYEPSAGLNRFFTDPLAVENLIALINKKEQEEAKPASEEVLAFIDQICAKMPNRQLKGHYAQTEEEVLELPYDEVDLARGLFLSQFREEDAFLKIKTYEAALDLMALQIFVNLPANPTPERVIREISRFIFEEKGYRFPPHSVYAKNIDLYTFLPSVLDSRRGVCLGVSILYLCIAQRLGLELEMITPPGHIYIRYRRNGKTINIETTARGIHLDSDEYLSVDTRSLQERNIKEVIGLAHFNEASVHWKDTNHKKALECYHKAQAYLPKDMLLKELMGYNYLLDGQIEKGRQILTQVQNNLPEYAVCKETIAEDYLNGEAGVDGLEAVLMQIDEKRESLLKKKDALQIVVNKYPKFRAGLLSLATTWLQLHREGEAVEILKKYHQIDSHDATVEYYLSVLSAMRFDYNRAWKHLVQAEKIVQKRQHYPKVLKELRRELIKISPEPHDYYEKN